MWRETKALSPGDDDVDIYMPRDDWDKLVELSDQVLPPNRAFQCVDVDRNYTNTFPRYASTDTCAIHRHQIIGKDKAGEIIDVLTLDPIPDDDREYEKLQNTPDDLFRSDQHSSGVRKPLRGTGSSVSEISFFLSLPWKRENLEKCWRKFHVFVQRRGMQPLCNALGRLPLPV